MSFFNKLFGTEKEKEKSAPPKNSKQAPPKKTVEDTEAKKIKI